METPVTQIRMSDYPGSRPVREIWQTTNDPLPTLKEGTSGRAH